MWGAEFNLAGRQAIEKGLTMGGVLICFSGAESRVQKAKTGSTVAEARYEAS